MKLSLFVAEEDTPLVDKYLVLSEQTETIPRHLGTGWRYVGTLENSSLLFHGVAIELQLQRRGYVLVVPPVSGVWS